jgi:hypothetical protein
MIVDQLLSKYDREKKEQQSALQLASQPNTSWECKDVFLQKMKPNIDEHISSNRLKELTPYVINYTIICILVWSTDITYFPKYKKNNI